MYRVVARIRAAMLLLRFAVAVIEAVDVQEPCPDVVLPMQVLERWVRGAQCQGR